MQESAFLPCVGIDFGTTNSMVTAAIDEGDGKNVLSRFISDTSSVMANMVANETEMGGMPHPSVICFTDDGITKVGWDAKRYLQNYNAAGEGGVIRSPKSLVGKLDTVNVGGVERKVVDIVADVFSFLRSDAKAQLQRLNSNNAGLETDIRDVVLTIPVNMKAPARRILRASALRAGLRVHMFVHEPMAALYAFLRGDGLRPNFGEYENGRYLVFDWGGGTLDLTLCEIRDGRIYQVANEGTNRVGGDRFDEALLKRILDRHLDANPDLSISDLSRTTRPGLLEQAEQAKIMLSSGQQDEYDAVLAGIFSVAGPARNLRIQLNRKDLVEASSSLIREGMALIDIVLEKAGWSIDQVTCLAAGGTCQMSVVRDELRQKFGPSRLFIPKRGDMLISEGAAWIARDRCRISLSKGVYIEDARKKYVAMLDAGQRLPTGQEQPVSRKFPLWCVDPRQGYARVRLTRPSDLEGLQKHVEYGQIAAIVDSKFEPLSEGVDLTLTIDRDLVLVAGLQAETTKDNRSIEIHDLEFCLEVAED